MAAEVNPPAPVFIRTHYELVLSLDAYRECPCIMGALCGRCMASAWARRRYARMEDAWVRHYVPHGWYK